MSKSIFITGSAGFIGSNFVMSLSNKQEFKNYKIISLDKLNYAGSKKNLSNLRQNIKHFFIKGDITNKYLLSKILKKYKPIYIINFAAETHVDRSIRKSTDFIKTNIVGTHTLLEIAKSYFDNLNNYNKKKFRFINVSTDEVYGSLKINEKPFKENNRLKPNSPYSASKASSDLLVRAWWKTYKFPVITTNCSNNYGPYQFPEKLIPLCITNALKGKPLPIYGDGKQIRDWLHVSDHCNAIIQLMKKGKLGQSYNIGGSNEKTNISVVKKICQVLDKIRPLKNGRTYKSQIQFVKDRPGHDLRYAVNSSKIKLELGWKPKETFDSGIKKTVEWYLENFEWMEGVQNKEYKKWIKLQYK